MVVSVVLLLVLALNCQLISTARFEFEEYTREAKALDGTQCMTGCSPIDKKCIVDWKGNKKDCRSFEPAPIYFTARLEDPDRKYCISKCGYFEEEPWEWCITTKDMKRDFCSSYSRKEENTITLKVIESKTRRGADCLSVCTACHHTTSFCCDIHVERCSNETKKWDYCAPPALSRIPVVPADYHIGTMKKGKCDDFLQSHYTGNSPKFYELKSSVPDDFLSTFADGIETTTGENDSVAKIHKLSKPETSIEKYIMVNINETFVPAVIRAHVTSKTISIQKNISDISESIKQKVRHQFSEDVSDYVLENIIAPEIGGLNGDYNIVPMSSDTSCAWYELSNAIRRWTRDTGGSVDILAVVFYKNVDNPVPKGFGISLTFRNGDNSIFVACQEQIYWSLL